MIKNDELQILLVEDHYNLAETVCDFLEAHHMVVDHAANCSLAKKLLNEQAYHLVILDINLPDGDGYQLCEFMRHELGLSTPVIMLTARDTLDDKLIGFKSGTDDYLVKPFDLPELVARIVALVNRTRGLVGEAQYTIADLSLDIKANKVLRANQAINLSPIQFSILSLLMRKSPNIVTRKELEIELWGEETPETDSLRSHVYSLRKLIDKPFEHKLIQTVSGIGFKIEG